MADLMPYASSDTDVAVSADDLEASLASIAHAIVLATRLSDNMPELQQLCREDASQMQTCLAAAACMTEATDECLRALAELPQLEIHEASSQSGSEAGGISVAANAAASAGQQQASDHEADRASAEATIQLQLHLQQWADRVTSGIGTRLADTSLRDGLAANIAARLRAVMSPANSLDAKRDIKLITDHLRRPEGRASAGEYAASVLSDLCDALPLPLESGHGAVVPPDSLAAGEHANANLPAGQVSSCAEHY